MNNYNELSSAESSLTNNIVMHRGGIKIKTAMYIVSIE